MIAGGVSWISRDSGYPVILRVYAPDGAQQPSVYLV